MWAKALQVIHRNNTNSFLNYSYLQLHIHISVFIYLKSQLKLIIGGLVCDITYYSDLNLLGNWVALTISNQQSVLLMFFE